MATTKHDSAAVEQTLRAIALGCPPTDVRFAVAETVLQVSRTQLDRLVKIPVEQGGLELRHDGRTSLISFSSIKHRLALRKAGKSLPVRKRTAAEKEREAEKRLNNKKPRRSKRVRS
jgi:hypothetical protein